MSNFPRANTPLFPGSSLSASGESTTQTIFVNMFFPLFDPAASYVAGQGVRSATNEYYVAVRDLAPGTTLVTGDDWQEIGEVTAAEVAAAVAAYLRDNPVSDPRIFIQSTEPTSGLVDGAIWIDTSGVVNTLNIYNSTQGQFNLVESVTNLAVNRGATSVTITSSSGTDATIGIANTASAGVMSAADKTKLDGIEAGADIDRGGRTWSTTATYTFGDIVTRLGRQYQAIVSTPTEGSDPETTPTEWKLLINNTIPTTDPVDAAAEFIRQTTAPSLESVRAVRDDLQGQIDAIPDFVALSNLPRLTADLVADRTYVVWVTNNTGTAPAAIDRTAVDIQGQDAATLNGSASTTVSVTAGRTIPLYVTWNATAVGDIQNNATFVDPTVTFTTPAATVHVAPGEDVTTGGSEITVQDEGVSLATAATTLDFEGAGVTAAGTGTTKTITVPDYTIRRETTPSISNTVAIELNDRTNGFVNVAGAEGILVGTPAGDGTTIEIRYQEIPPVHPENLTISVNPTHVIEDTPNVSATVTLRETGTNWRITGVTSPTSSRTGVSFGAVSGSGTQTVTIPVTITSQATADIGNISLSFRVSGNNGLPTTDPNYQQYRSVVRNVNIAVSPVWYADVLTSAPTALNDFSGNRGEFLVGAQEELTGVADGTIYVAIPTAAVDDRVRFTTSNPNIFYEFTTRSPIGDFSIFNLGTAVAGTYIVRIGGV